MYRFYSKSSPRVTVVAEYSKKDKLLKIAVARCSKKDRFIRKEGRTLAEKRLKNGEYFREIYLKTAPSNYNFAGLASYIAHEVGKTKEIIYNEETIHTWRGKIFINTG